MKEVVPQRIAIESAHTGLACTTAAGRRVACEAAWVPWSWRIGIAITTAKAKNQIAQRVDADMREISRRHSVTAATRTSPCHRPATKISAAMRESSEKVLAFTRTPPIQRQLRPSRLRPSGAEVLRR